MTRIRRVNWWKTSPYLTFIKTGCTGNRTPIWRKLNEWMAAPPCSGTKSTARLPCAPSTVTEPLCLWISVLRKGMRFIPIPTRTAPNLKLPCRVTAARRSVSGDTRKQRCRRTGTALDAPTTRSFWGSRWGAAAYAWPRAPGPVWVRLTRRKTRANTPARGRASAARGPAWCHRDRRSTVRETAWSAPARVTPARPATPANTPAPEPASTATTAGANRAVTEPAASAWATTSGTSAPDRAPQARAPATLPRGTTNRRAARCTASPWPAPGPASAARTAAGLRDSPWRQTAWSVPARASPATAPGVRGAPWARIPSSSTPCWDPVCQRTRCCRISRSQTASTTTAFTSKRFPSRSSRVQTSTSRLTTGRWAPGGSA